MYASDTGTPPLEGARPRREAYTRPGPSWGGTDAARRHFPAARLIIRGVHVRPSPRHAAGRRRPMRAIAGTSSPPVRCPRSSWNWFARQRGALRPSVTVRSSPGRRSADTNSSAGEERCATAAATWHRSSEGGSATRLSSAGAKIPRSLPGRAPKRLAERARRGETDLQGNIEDRVAPRREQIHRALQAGLADERSKAETGLVAEASPQCARARARETGGPRQIDTLEVREHPLHGARNFRRASARQLVERAWAHQFEYNAEQRIEVHIGAPIPWVARRGPASRIE